MLTDPLFHCAVAGLALAVAQLILAAFNCLCAPSNTVVAGVALDDRTGVQVFYFKDW
jgi:hypothetical protein